VTPWSRDALAKIREFYDREELHHPAGVVHVLAVQRQPGRSDHVIAVGPNSPVSVSDRFALDLARARSDVIITTGQILRDEPNLRYELGSRWATELYAWRREVAEHDCAPVVVVLTAGARLNFGHPTFHSWARPVVFTSERSATHLCPPTGVRVIGSNAPSLRAAIEWANGEGARTIVVEAGPSTARDLYLGTPVVDEVMLSVFEGGHAPIVPGGEFAELNAMLEHSRCASDVSVPEPSGTWRLQRWLTVRPSDP